MLLLLSLLGFATTKQLSHQMSSFEDPRHDIQPRIVEEADHPRYHLMFDDFSSLFDPSHNPAFWGFSNFYPLVVRQLAAQFQADVTRTQYSCTLGFLELSAASTSSLPIAWGTLEWIMGRLHTWAQNGFGRAEFDAWVTDTVTQAVVEVTLRVLLDRPLD